MNKYRIILASLIIFLFGVTAGYCLETILSEKNYGNTADAVEISTEAQDEVAKPAVLLFHSRRCSSCTKILPVWKALKKEYKNDYQFLEIDVDEIQNVRLCKEFLITTIPSIYIEDAPFRNRAYVNPVMYGYLPRFSDELARYLDVRKILKKAVYAGS